MASQPSYTDNVLAAHCPTCDAQPGAQCVTRSGKTATEPHKARATAPEIHPEPATLEPAAAEQAAKAKARDEARAAERAAKAQHAAPAGDVGTVRQGGQRVPAVRAGDTVHYAEGGMWVQAPAKLAATFRRKAKNSHEHCTHPRTHEGRVACRKARALAAKEASDAR